MLKSNKIKPSPKEYGKPNPSFLTEGVLWYCEMNLVHIFCLAYQFLGLFACKFTF